jgi:hypothetical protein
MSRCWEDRRWLFPSPVQVRYIDIFSYTIYLTSLKIRCSRLQKVALTTRLVLIRRARLPVSLHPRARPVVLNTIGNPRSFAVTDIYDRHPNDEASRKYHSPPSPHGSHCSKTCQTQIVPTPHRASPPLDEVAPSSQDPISNIVRASAGGRLAPDLYKAFESGVSRWEEERGENSGGTSMSSLSCAKFIDACSFQLLRTEELTRESACCV